jgi:cysteinyl-tRNA synthetase
MSKRFGNITTARDLRQDGVDPGAVRLLMFQVHYRKQLDLTDEALASAREGSRRLGEFQNRLFAATGTADGPLLGEAAARLERELTEALDDDLNAPRAVAAVFDFAKAGNAALDAGESAGPRGLAAWRRAEGVLAVTSSVQSVKVGSAVDAGVGGGELRETLPAEQDEETQRSWAIRWAVRRKEAKTGKNFPEADRIRGLLKAAGWEVRDNRDGSIEVVQTGNRA